MPRIKGFVTNFDERYNQMTSLDSSGHQSRRRTGWSRQFPALVACCLIPLVLAACTEADSPARGVASAVGFATTVPQAKDFVVARRSSRPLEYIPVGRGGIERPVQPRDIPGVRALESDLDSTRDRSEAFARRSLPRGAYGQALPSVAAPPRPARAASARPDAGSPGSYPVSPNRARALRDNARAAGATAN
jgi:hypothetical protein